MLNAILQSHFEVDPHPTRRWTWMLTFEKPGRVGLDRFCFWLSRRKMVENSFKIPRESRVSNLQNQRMTEESHVLKLQTPPILILVEIRCPKNPRVLKSGSFYSQERGEVKHEKVWQLRRNQMLISIEISNDPCGSLSWLSKYWVFLAMIWIRGAIGATVLQVALLPRVCSLLFRNLVLLAFLASDFKPFFLDCFVFCSRVFLCKLLVFFLPY